MNSNLDAPTVSYKAGVVGSGLAAAVYHLPAQRASSRIETIGLCGRNRVTVDRLAQEFAVPRTYSNYLEMLEREALDFVTVCVPPALHLEVTEAAAVRGVDVICEKPLVPTRNEAIRIAEVIAQNGIRFMVAENFNWLPDLLEVRRRLDAGAIGDVFHVRLETFINEFNPQRYWQRDEKFLLMESGTHYVDVIRKLVGKEALRVHAVTRHVGNQDLCGENFATLTIEFEGGIVARIDDCWCSTGLDQFVMRLRIDGLSGCIQLNPPSARYRIFSDRDGICSESDASVGAQAQVGHKPEYGFSAPWPVNDLLLGEIGTYQAWIDYLDGRAVSPTCIEDNLKTMEIIFAAYESAEKGTVMTLNR